MKKRTTFLIVVLTMFAIQPMGAGSPNFLENEYSGGWIVEPPGFGRWTPHPDVTGRQLLELKSLYSGAYWSLGGLPYQEDVSYEMLARIKAPPGVSYRYYIAANLTNGQKVFSGTGSGSGAWQVHRVGFRFTGLKGVYTERAYLVIELTSPGTLLVSDVQLLKATTNEKQGIE